MKTFRSGAVFLCDDTKFEVVEIASNGMATVKCLSDSEHHTCWYKDKIIYGFCIGYGAIPQYECFLVDK